MKRIRMFFSFSLSDFPRVGNREVVGLIFSLQVPTMGGEIEIDH